MDKEKAIEVLKQIQEDSRDTEKSHIYADTVLCDLLKALGLGDVVVEYDKIGKWYA